MYNVFLFHLPAYSSLLAFVFSLHFSISMEILEEKCGDETYAFNECYESNEAAEACVHCALEELFASGVGCSDDLRSKVDKDASTCTECLEECGTQFEALAECSIEEFCGKEARSAALSFETDDGDSIASWTSDKDTHKSAEFRYLPSGSTEDSFAASNRRYSGEKSNLQRWEFNQDTGSISNIACPNLAISSSKQKDVSLNSIYFALQNPRTQLAIGISEESCRDGMALTMQDLEYGSLNQQFIYIEAGKKIVSVKCPDFAITIPNEDCDTTENLLMSSNQNVGDRNKWLFDDKEIIQSVQCPNKFITINGALSGGARLVTVSNKFLKEETPDSTASHSPMKAVGEPQETPGNASFGGPPKQSDATNSPTVAYTNKSHEANTIWDSATPPSVGSTVTLSELNAERYQKWTKQRQV